jgi:hypothetical protein
LLSFIKVHAAYETYKCTPDDMEQCVYATSQCSC